MKISTSVLPVNFHIDLNFACKRRRSYEKKEEVSALAPTCPSLLLCLHSVIKLNNINNITATQVEGFISPVASGHSGILDL